MHSEKKKKGEKKKVIIFVAVRDLLLSLLTRIWEPMRLVKASDTNTHTRAHVRLHGKRTVATAGRSTLHRWMKALIGSTELN